MPDEQLELFDPNPYEVRQLPMTPDEIAYVCHSANRALQKVQNDPSIPVSPRWVDVSEEMRESAIDGVRGVLAGNTPEESHENWMKFKLDRGWTIGPVKDEEKREHPLLVPYAELPASQRIKDALFVAVVRALGEQLI